MKRNALLTLAVLVFLLSADALAVEHTNDSLKTVRKNIDDGNAVLVDVREQREWDRGHLKNALLIALSDLRDARGPESLDVKLSKKKIIYCHCQAGVRVIPAGKIFESWGFDVRPLEAGYADLLKAGFEKSK